VKKIVAIYPGTFDPITYGHIDVINRASEIFENLVIAVAEDSNKSPIFSLSDRVKMINNEIIPLNNVNNSIQVTSFSGLLIDFALKVGAKVILRGLRAASDFEYEFQMSFMNHKLSPVVETLFLPATQNGHFISSKIVKELARLNGDLSGFVSNNVAKELYDYYKNP
jgi:pantetheine-phosphate adenylyltransferase